MLETKTFTSATSSPSIRWTASITLSWTRSATSRRTAVESTVRKTSRWILRSPSSTTRTPRCAVSRLIQSPKWRALASSRPMTPSSSRAAIPAMLAITSLATRTLPGGAAWSMTSDSLNVVPRTGVHPDAVALVDEQRDLHAGACLQAGGLGRARDGVAAHARLGLRDLEIDGQRQLDPDHGVLVAQHADRVALLQEGQHVLQLGAADRHLVVRARVHEVVEVALAVEVRRLPLLDPHGLELLAAAEALLEDGAVADVPQLGLDDGARAGQLDVLHRENAQQLAVHLEGGSHSEVVRLDQPAPTPLPNPRPRAPPWPDPSLSTIPDPTARLPRLDLPGGRRFSAGGRGPLPTRRPPGPRRRPRPGPAPAAAPSRPCRCGSSCRVGW